MPSKPTSRASWKRSRRPSSFGSIESSTAFLIGPAAAAVRGRSAASAEAARAVSRKARRSVVLMGSSARPGGYSQEPRVLNRALTPRARRGLECPREHEEQSHEQAQRGGDRPA